MNVNHHLDAAIKDVEQNAVICKTCHKSMAKAVPRIYFTSWNVIHCKMENVLIFPCGCLPTNQRNHQINQLWYELQLAHSGSMLLYVVVLFCGWFSDLWSGRDETCTSGICEISAFSQCAVSLVTWGRVSSQHRCLCLSTFPEMT